MYLSKTILACLVVMLGLSCTERESADDVKFENTFKGARMDSVQKLGDNRFIAYISPAFEPVNPSAYFAFAVSAKDRRTIEITLDYAEHKHRYLPKLSLDKSSWTVIDSSRIVLDTLKHTATIKVEASPTKLFIAAQEIESSKDTYDWLDGMVKEHPETKKRISGETVLGHPNYCLEFENEETKDGIALVARQHPPETPGGTIGFKAFYEELFSDAEIAKEFRGQFNIYTFPLLNPDGADMGNWRHNANGVDLNRDWQDFTQPETKMVKAYFEEKLEKGKKIRFALDFHTSFSGPYLLVLDSLNLIKSKGITSTWIKNIEDNSSFLVEDRKRSQELPYCYNYFFNQLKCEAVTYEDGDEIDRAQIRQRAKVYAKELMKTLIAKKKANAFND